MTENKIDYANFDTVHRYDYREDRIRTAKTLGYNYISECTASLYKELKSTRKVAALLNMSADGIASELKQMGVTMQGRGGFRPGDLRGTNKRAHSGHVTSI